MCVGTVLCVANTKAWLFQYSVMCGGGWKHSRVHPIKRLPLVCVWFRVTMRTMEPGWQWRPLVTTGRMHSACPVNPSQVPTSERFLISRGKRERGGGGGGILGDTWRCFIQEGCWGSLRFLVFCAKPNIHILKQSKNEHLWSDDTLCARW